MLLFLGGWLSLIWHLENTYVRRNQRNLGG
jgi:hypothetical protein